MEYKDHPKSLRDRQCIGPCYPANKTVYHPQTLGKFINKNSSVCPTSKYYDENNEQSWLDFCKTPTANLENMKLNLLAPPIN